MEPNSNSRFDALPLSARHEVNRVCLEFEEAWRSGRRPRIEDFVACLTGPAGEVLLVELIAQEMDLRVADGQAISIQEYYERFPESAQEVQAAHELIHAREQAGLFGDATLARSAVAAPATLADASPQPGGMSQLQQDFASLLARLIGSIREGEQYALEQLTRDYPQHADGLRLVHPGMQLLADISSGVAQVPGRPVAGMLGDYQLIREIGRGGMGIVYEARQVSLDKRVAVKVLPFASVLDARRLQRFRNEARAAAQLQHEHIVPVYSVGSDRGVHYYAMQLIEGNNLAEVIRSLRRHAVSEGSFKPSTVPDARAETELHVPASTPACDDSSVRAGNSDTAEKIVAQLSTKKSFNSLDYYGALAQLGVQAAKALQHAHDMGVVHRDIKPSNLLLDVTGKLWIVDFGLAHVHDAVEVTVTGDVVGTLRYMSPEQALAKRVVVDHRTDIYSLGVTLYELVTTRRAFDGKSRADVLRAIAFGAPTAPRRINRHIPAEFETIILKAMSKNPDERYQTAQEFAEDLESFRANRPIQAKPPRLYQRVEKWLRRNPAYTRTMAFTALLVLALSLMAAVTSWGELVNEQQRRARVQRLLQRSEGSRLTAHSRLELDEDPGLAVLLGIEGARRNATRAARDALLSALDAMHERQTLEGHTAAVGQAKFSRDGRFVVTAAVHPYSSADSDPARIWDTASGDLLASLDDGTQITGFAVSPDNVRVLTTTNPYPAWDARHVGPEPRAHRPPCVWDALTGRKILTVTEAYLPEAHDAALSADGLQLVASFGDRAARIWDLLSGRPVATFEGHGGRVIFAAFSPDSRLIATIAEDRVVRIWQVETRQRLCEIPWPAAAGDTPWACAFSPNGQWLLTTSVNSGSLVWDVQTGQRVNSTRWYGTHALFSADGSRVISHSPFSRTAEIYDVVTGQHVATLQGHRHDIQALSLSPDGQLILTASDDRTLRLWDADTGELRSTLLGHGEKVNSGSFSPDGRQVVSASTDRTARLWNVRSGKERATLATSAATWPQLSVAFDPGGRRVLVPNQQTVRTLAWDQGAGAPQINVPGKHWDVPATSSQLVTSSGNQIFVWNRSTGEQLASSSGLRGSAREVRLSGDGRIVLVVVSNGSSWIWHWQTGRRIDLAQHVDGVLTAGISPDGRQAATGALDGRVCVWNTETGARLAEFPHASGVVQVHFSRDGGQLLTLTDLNLVHLWNLSTGEKALSFFAEGGSVDEVRMSRDGNRLLTFNASGNGALRVWDAKSGALVAALADCPAHICAEFSPAGPQVAVASVTLGTMVWDYEQDERHVLSATPATWATFNADGTRLAAATCYRYGDPTLEPPNDRQGPQEAPAIQVWNLAARELSHSIPLDGYSALSLQFQAGNDQLWANVASHSVTIADYEQGTVQPSIAGHAKAISAAVFTADGRQIVTSSWDHTASVWDAQTGARVHRLAAHQGAVLHAAVLGDRIATASADATCRLWSRQSGQPLAVLAGHADQVSFVVFRPDGQRLLTASRDNTVRLWSLDGQELDRLELKQGRFVSAEFQPVGPGLLVVPGLRYALMPSQVPDHPVMTPIDHSDTSEFAVRFYPSFSGDRFGSDYLALAHEHVPLMASFNFKGNRIVTVDSYGLAFLWDTTGKKLLTLRRGNQQIEAAVFDPTGRYLLVATSQSLVLCDSETGDALMTLRSETPMMLRTMQSLLGARPYNPFSPDGRWIVTVTTEGQARVWPVDPMRIARDYAPRALTSVEKLLFDITPETEPAP